MSRLLLIRHSVPATDPCVSASQWPLSDLGRQRCPPLARCLAAYQPFTLYSSREAKAVETAALVARELRLAFATRPGLHEHARASVPWLPAAEFQAGVSALFARPSEVVFGDESADQAHARFSAAIQSLLVEQPAGSLAVVTHGTVMSLFVGRAAGLAPASIWRELGLPAVIVLNRSSLGVEHIIPEVVHVSAEVG
jgi:broad specificity phosphatase PhoE